MATSQSSSPLDPNGSFDAVRASFCAAEVGRIAVDHVVLSYGTYVPINSTATLEELAIGIAPLDGCSLKDLRITLASGVLTIVGVQPDRPVNATRDLHFVRPRPRVEIWVPEGWDGPHTEGGALTEQR